MIGTKVVDDHHIEIEVSDEFIKEEMQKNRHIRNHTLSNYTPPKMPNKQVPTGRDGLRGRMPNFIVPRQRPSEQCCAMSPIEAPSSTTPEDLIYVTTQYNHKGDARVQLIRSNLRHWCWKTIIIRRKPFFGLFKSRSFNDRVNECVEDMEKLRLECLSRDERRFQDRIKKGWH